MSPSDAQTYGVAPHAQGCVISLTVAPRSPSNRIEIDTNGAIRVRITAPPVDGAANARLLKFLADVLDTPPSSLEVIAGAQARHKRVLVKGMNTEQAWTAISGAVVRK
jgi:uncharacterized protein (TIGR00251 family)